MQPLVFFAPYFHSHSLRLRAAWCFYQGIWTKTHRNKWKGFLWFQRLLHQEHISIDFQAPTAISSFMTTACLYSLCKVGILLPIIQDQQVKLHWKSCVMLIFSFRYKGTFLVEKQHLELHPPPFQVNKNNPGKLAPHPVRDKGAQEWAVGIRLADAN